MERFSFIFLIAGLGFFALAFAVSAVLPTLPVADLQAQTLEELAANPPLTFIELKDQYPRAYRKAFFKTSDEDALTQLQQNHPDVFEAVFTKGEEESLALLEASYPNVFEQVFGEVDAEEAGMDYEEDPEDYQQQIKDADAEAYEVAFELSVRGALATLYADYAITLLKIRQADPAAYDAIFEERPDAEVFAEALATGHRIYIGDACWHCHSQQVRPWGRDEARYGQISYPEEYHNALNYPPLWGTRRVGPDLIRRGGKQSNDWHVAHFFNPRHTSPVSVMPNYPWFFEDDGLTPNRKGLSIIAYVQWLGSWQDSRDETIHSVGDIERGFEPPGNGGDADDDTEGVE